MIIAAYILATCIVLAGLAFCWLVADASGTVGFILATGWLALCYLVHGWVTEPHETVELDLRKWTCTATQPVYLAPTYVRVGGVLTPVGGGTTNECTQYGAKP